MIILKLIGVLILMVASYFFVKLVKEGRELRYTSSPYSAEAVARHTQNLLYIDISLVLAVVDIEIMVRLSPHGYEHLMLMGVHLFFVLLFMLLYLAIRLKYNGLQARAFHATLAYSCITSLLAALGTGIVLLILL